MADDYAGLIREERSRITADLIAMRKRINNEWLQPQLEELQEFCEKTTNHQFYYKNRNGDIVDTNNCIHCDKPHPRYGETN